MLLAFDPWFPGPMIALFLISAAHILYKETRLSISASSKKSIPQLWHSYTVAYGVRAGYRCSMSFLVRTFWCSIAMMIHHPGIIQMRYFPMMKHIAIGCYITYNLSTI